MHRIIEVIAAAVISFTAAEIIDGGTASETTTCAVFIGLATLRLTYAAGKGLYRAARSSMGWRRGHADGAKLHASRHP